MTVSLGQSLVSAIERGGAAGEADGVLASQGLGGEETINNKSHLRVLAS
jgi:hypothetical protein